MIAVENFFGVFCPIVHLQINLGLKLRSTHSDTLDDLEYS
jgi:hypothetical protein